MVINSINSLGPDEKNPTVNAAEGDYSLFNPIPDRERLETMLSEGSVEKVFEVISKELISARRQEATARARFVHAGFDPSMKEATLIKLCEEATLAEAKAHELSMAANVALYVASIYAGLPEYPPEGQVRLFRGVEREWTPERNIGNSFWSPDPQVAKIFANGQDIVVCDVPRTEIYFIPDADLGTQFEVQIPNPDITREARIIYRNGRLISSEGNLPETTRVTKLLNFAKALVQKPKRQSQYPLIDKDFNASTYIE